MTTVDYVDSQKQYRFKNIKLNCCCRRGKIFILLHAPWFLVNQPNVCLLNLYWLYKENVTYFASKHVPLKTCTR